MSYVSFMGEGFSGMQAEYRRNAYPKDHIKSIGTTNIYLGAITESPTIGKMKESVIDGAVKVTTVSDKVREEAKDLWRGLKDGCFGTFAGTLCVSIAAGTGATVLVALMPALWPVAVAVGIVALAILGFSIWNVCRGVQAKDELVTWNDPMPDYQQERMKVGQKGFHYAYSNRFKGKYVSEEELKNLWFKSMDNWAERYQSHISQDSVKLYDIRTFMEESPLKGQALDYTFPEPSGVDAEEMEFIRTLSDKYTALKNGYDTVRYQTETLKKKIRNEKSAKLLQNDQWMHSCLAPYEALLYAQKMDLIAQQTAYNKIIITYESSISPYHANSPYSTHGTPTLTLGGHVSVGQSHRHHNPFTGAFNGHFSVGQGNHHHHTQFSPTFGGQLTLGHPSIGHTQGFGGHHTYGHTQVVPAHVIQARMGLQGINTKLAKMDLAFAAMTAPIRSVHAKNRANVNAWANHELSKIEVSEDQTLIKFYPPIKALLEAYQNRNDEEEESFEDLDTEIKAPIEPEAPEIRDDYEASAFDPSWKEFVYEVDWDNKILKKTQIEHEGNKTTSTTHYDL